MCIFAKRSKNDAERENRSSKRVGILSESSIFMNALFRTISLHLPLREAALVWIYLQSV